MKNAFLTASRKKLRFSTNKGTLSTEDLWDLTLEALDNIAVALDEKVQKAGRKSFIGTRDKASATDELRFEVIKAVIDYKIEAAAKAKARATITSEREFLNRLASEKKLKELENLDMTEIQKRLDALKEDGDDEE